MDYTKELHDHQRPRALANAEDPGVEILQSTQIGNATVAYATFKRHLIHIFAI